VDNGRFGIAAIPFCMASQVSGRQLRLLRGNFGDKVEVCLYLVGDFGGEDVWSWQRAGIGQALVLNPEARLSLSRFRISS
jgi:hypothetical protein